MGRLFRQTQAQLTAPQRGMLDRRASRIAAMRQAVRDAVVAPGAGLMTGMGVLLMELIIAIARARLAALAARLARQQRRAAMAAVGQRTNGGNTAPMGANRAGGGANNWSVAAAAAGGGAVLGARRM